MKTVKSVICGRLALSPNHVFNPKPGDKHSLCKGPFSNVCIPMAALATGKGGGLLERPVIEKGTPDRESEKSRKIGPQYRVFLHNDDFNRHDYVVQVLMKVIPGMIRDYAYEIMLEAHYNGRSVVIICAQALAEVHSSRIRGNDLFSSIEPARGGCC